MSQMSKALGWGRLSWVPRQAVSMMHILQKHTADAPQVRWRQHDREGSLYTLCSHIRCWLAFTWCAP